MPTLVAGMLPALEKMLMAERQHRRPLSGASRAARCATVRRAAFAIVVAAISSAAPGAERPEIVQRDERFWQSIAASEPPETMTTRQLFGYLRTLCEGRQHADRMGRLVDLAARAQDRETGSRGFGNLKWTWRDPGVTDYNAVEFVMPDAATVWLDHREVVPEDLRPKLREIMEYGLEGCLRHRVPTTYTNIAILNAGNVIVLGELLGRQDAVDEGYGRLEAITLWTWAFGIAEFCTPTYYGVDIDGLEFLRARAKRARGREQAAALLALLWTDTAMNYFPPAQKLAGAHSRSYDYLRGLGYLDLQLGAVGWLDAKNASRLRAPAYGVWMPPRRLHEESRTRLPRVVRQRWGMGLPQSRTHALYPDVTLSCASAAYGTQDVLLSVDLPGDRSGPRCYFIPDGREDPYGKKRFETGAAKHLKALHLAPFWAAAQRTRDALGVVLYRKGDLAEAGLVNLQSHFVLRRPSDGIWIDGAPVQMPQGLGASPATVPLPSGRPLVARYGSAAMGICVPWSRAQDGQPAAAALIDDANPHGVLRLSIEHRREAVTAEAGAALWVRIGSGLATPEAFASWRERFERATALAVEVSDRLVRIEVPGEEGAVSVSARAPFGQGGPVQLLPQPTQGILELDGAEIGRPILERVEPVLSCGRSPSALEPIAIPAQGGVAWEAESGLVLHGMTTALDPNASQGRFVVQPLDTRIARLAGSVVWAIEVARPGRYYLWARVLAPDAKTNSFFVAAAGDFGESLPKTTWSLRETPRWQWQRLGVGQEKTGTPLQLPAGLCRVRLMVREPGTKIDRLLLTPDPSHTPQ